MQVETWVHIVDLSVPHLTGGYVVIDQFGSVTHEPIDWEYLGNGVYRERGTGGNDENEI